MPFTPQAPTIFVVAGVNGAGKSSVTGDALREIGVAYFNPDEVAQKLQREKGSSLEKANIQAWQEGKERLESAIRDRADYAFETTLGGHTIARLLADAARAGIDVRVWFVGLGDPEQHIARVRARVAAGGHNIPEAKIRERWDSSRRNIAKLLPLLSELKVFDNSAERDPITGELPPPLLVLEYWHGQIIHELENAPAWAQPIISAAHKLDDSGR